MRTSMEEVEALEARIRHMRDEIEHLHTTITLLNSHLEHLEAIEKFWTSIRNLSARASNRARWMRLDFGGHI